MSRSGNIIRLQVPCSSAVELERSASQEDRWNLAGLAGRLTEISATGASAALTCAVGLVIEAQRAGEPVAWIARGRAAFFPPDLADSGVDLAALAVVRAPDLRAAARAADHLLRSGAFGLIVLDLGRDAVMPTPVQGRLVGLAQRHDTALVCLTDKPGDRPSLGSMVSLRAEALREPAEGHRFRCKVKVLKDKRRGPHWTASEVVRGPAGLR